MKLTFTWRKTLGYGLLVVSCIAWALLPIIPFIDITTTEKAAWAGGMFIFAEVTWWLAVPLLGKELLAWSRATWQWVLGLLGRETAQSGLEETAQSGLEETAQSGLEETAQSGLEKTAQSGLEKTAHSEIKTNTASTD